MATRRAVLFARQILTFKDALNIALLVQNPNDANGVFVQKVINPGGLKPRDRP